MSDLIKTGFGYRKTWICICVAAICVMGFQLTYWTPQKWINMTFNKYSNSSQHWSFINHINYLVFGRVEDLSGLEWSETPYRGYWTDPEGGLLQRIAGYQNFLTEVRGSIMKQFRNESWELKSKPVNMDSILGWEDNYLDKVSENANITTLFLKWTDLYHNKVIQSHVLHQPNLLLPVYYKWTVSEPLCTWIKTRTNMLYGVVHNYTCETEISTTKIGSNLDTYVLHGKPVNRRWYHPKNDILPAWKLTETPEFVMYVHVIQNALVSGDGHVLTESVHLVQDTCGLQQLRIPKAVFESPIFDEVFVVYQYWGKGFFHRMLETMPKIVPYVAFLRRHEHIKLLLPPLDTLMKKMLDILQISSTRAISSHFRANIVYLPRSTPCGFPLVQESQLFSRLFRDHTEKHLNPGARNKLVLIQRSGVRRFLHHPQIAELLQRVAARYDLNYTLWSDRPVAPLEEGMRMFHQAVLVVAPHGAGESNLLFSQPGTFVIEGVCNRPHVNLCYQRTAYILGHHYHGIPSSGGCESHIDIRPDKIERIVNEFLEIWKSKNTI